MWQKGEHNYITCTVNGQSIKSGGDAVMMEGKQGGEMEDEIEEKKEWERVKEREEGQQSGVREGR